MENTQVLQAMYDHLDASMKNPQDFVYFIFVLYNSGQFAPEQLQEKLKKFQEKSGKKASLALLESQYQRFPQASETMDQIRALLPKTKQYAAFKSAALKNSVESMDKESYDDDFSELLAVAWHTYAFYTRDESPVNFAAVSKMLKLLDSRDLKPLKDFLFQDLFPRFYSRYAFVTRTSNNLARTIAASDLGYLMAIQKFNPKAVYDPAKILSCSNLLPTRLEELNKQYQKDWDKNFRQQEIWHDKSLFLDWTRCLDSANQRNRKADYQQ